MATEHARSTAYIFISRIVGMATKGGLVFLLTQYLLDPAEYGRLFLTISILSVAMLFANLGFEKAGARFITEYREDAPALVPLVVRKTLMFNVIAIIAVCGALSVSHRSIASAVGEPTIGGLLLLGIGYVATKSLKGTAVMFYQGYNVMSWAAIVNLLTSISLLGAVPGFVALGFGLPGALIGYTVSYGIGATLGFAVIFVRLYERRSESEPTNGQVSKKILRYSVPLTFTMGANVINSRVDTILLSVFRGPTAIAFYTLGKQVADFLVAPAHSLGFGISPTYGEQKANDALDQAAHLYERSVVYTVTLYGPAAAGVVLVAQPTIDLLFGSEYVGAGPVLQIFSVFVFLRALDTITTDALDFLGRARSRAIAKGITAVGNVLLNLVLIPPLGVIGAAVATVITYALYVGAELFVIADELPIGGRELLRVGLVVGGITLGMTAVVYPLTGFVSDVPSLLAVIGIGGLVWFALTVLTGVIDVRRLYATFT